VKIAVASDNSKWVIDEIVKDYRKYSSHKVVDIDEKADLAWVPSLWTFKNIYSSIRASKIVLQVHHIETDKIKEYNFGFFNKHVVAYIVPNFFTKATLTKYTDKPIYLFPYWLLSSRTTPKDEKRIMALKKAIGEGILIGSFQKDSVYDTNRPKLCKGPDVFLSIVKKLHKDYPIKVILSGHSRKYLIQNLKESKVPYFYAKDCLDINTLYDCLDWYFVTSRIEGGPQSVLECAHRRVKILSTKVGMSSMVLDKDCICLDEGDFIQKFKDNLDRRDRNEYNIKEFCPDVMIKKWDNSFKDINEGCF